MDLVISIVGLVVLAGIAIYASFRIGSDVIMSKEQFDKLIDVLSSKEKDNSNNSIF